MRKGLFVSSLGWVHQTLKCHYLNSPVVNRYMRGKMIIIFYKFKHSRLSASDILWVYLVGTLFGRFLLLLLVTFLVIPWFSRISANFFDFSLTFQHSTLQKPYHSEGNHVHLMLFKCFQGWICVDCYAYHHCIFIEMLCVCYPGLFFCVVRLYSVVFRKK